MILSVLVRQVVVSFLVRLLGSLVFLHIKNIKRKEKNKTDDSAEMAEMRAIYRSSNKKSDIKRNQDDKPKNSG